MALKYQKHLAAQEDEATSNQPSVKQSQASTRASQRQKQSPTNKLSESLSSPKKNKRIMSELSCESPEMHSIIT
jgi:hypothetical protein